MFGIETLGGTAQATALVGIVLCEALVLHAGYGQLVDRTAPHLKRAIREV